MEEQEDRHDRIGAAATDLRMTCGEQTIQLVMTPMVIMSFTSFHMHVYRFLARRPDVMYSHPLQSVHSLPSLAFVPVGLVNRS